MEKQFRYTIEKYNLIEENDHIVVGFSGGADSLALLHLLKSIKILYNLSLTAVHIHHGVRGIEANHDAEFCQEICKILDIPIVIRYFDIKQEAKKHKLTEEEAGRKVRYDSFYEIMHEVSGNKIAVAHNQNDQAETVLMRFFRGTGIKGLSGIQVRRGEIIRPLLQIQRCEIEKYCLQNELLYRTDKTNEDSKYTRNSIRNILLPQIQRDYNQNIVSTLSRTASIIHEENNFLDNISNKILKEISTEENDRTIIPIQKLQSQDIVLQRRIVRQAYLKYSADLHDISSSHIQLILSLMEKESGKEIDLPQNLKASIQYGNLCLYKKTKITLPFEYKVEFDKEIIVSELNIKIIISLKCQELNCNIYTKAFDYDKISNALLLRNRRAGDKIFLSGIQGNKKLKDYFIDEKIPRSKRENILLLADGNQILWVADLLASDFYSVTKITKKVLYVHLLDQL